MKKFKRIYIEVTNQCNLSCSFCQKSLKKPEIMSSDAFGEILKKIDGFSDYIYLHIKGEPLLHPELETLLNHAHHHHLKVHLTTNGTLLQDQLEVLMNAKSVRQISISLQSYESTKDNVEFEDYLNNIFKSVQFLLMGTEVIIELRVWNFKELIGESLNEDNNEVLLSYIKKAFYLEADFSWPELEKKGVKLAKNVYLNTSQQFDWPDIHGEIIDCNGTCYGLRQQIGILANGDVVPCCLDGEGVICLGNIFMDDFQTIIESRRASSMKAGFEQGKLLEALCQRCGYRTRFNS